MKKISILYIGNDSLLVDYFSQLEDVDIHPFANGIKALRWLSDSTFNPFDHKASIENKRDISIVICETNLPGLNGFNLYKWLKKECLGFSIPFVLISKNFKQTMRMYAFKLGIDDYFSPPFSFEALNNRINHLILEKNDFIRALSEKHDQEKVFISEHKTKFIKRSFDIAVASGALIALSPVFIFTAIALKLESKGPVFYASKRVGANFKIFDFYKFRSMYPDADKRLKEVAHLNQYKDSEVELFCSECGKLPEGVTCSPVVYYDKERVCERMAIQRKQAKKAFLKIPNDPRITKVGFFIRNTSIDELPQLINVLKGDMSIVGNRPLPVNEANAITKSHWARRFRADAGLTGLWQVELRGKKGIMSEEERFVLDNQYAQNNSFWGDIKLILRTFPALFQKDSV